MSGTFGALQSKFHGFWTMMFGSPYGNHPTARPIAARARIAADADLRGCARAGSAATATASATWRAVAINSAAVNAAPEPKLAVHLPWINEGQAELNGLDVVRAPARTAQAAQGCSSWFLWGASCT
jgi:hypothetical protein